MKICRHRKHVEEVDKKLFGLHGRSLVARKFVAARAALIGGRQLQPTPPTCLSMSRRDELWLGTGGDCAACRTGFVQPQRLASWFGTTSISSFCLGRVFTFHNTFPLFSLPFSFSFHLCAPPAIEPVVSLQNETSQHYNPQA